MQRKKPKRTLARLGAETRGYYKRSYESYFQLALEEAMQKRRFMPVELNEVPAEPWEPEAWPMA